MIRPVETKILKPTDANLRLAANLIRKGEIVAFPTETVYGLGASVFDESAIKKIYDAKGRPSDNPLIAHVATKDGVEMLAKSLPESAARLVDAFWPAPLTVVVEKKSEVPSAVTAGLQSVAIRMPENDVARSFIAECGVPLAAPSANTSGRPSPTCAEHVFDDMAGKIEAIIDGGKCSVGVESTVVDCTVCPPVILRPGGLSREKILKVVPLGVLTAAGERPKAPGMKYRHYAPKADVVLCEGNRAGILAELGGWNDGGIAVLAADDLLKSLESELHGTGAKLISLGRNADDAAKRIFAAFRDCDALGIKKIVLTRFDTAGLGEALMNRIEKAASKK